ncbi:hypothetical protein BDW22DRAFT_296956 [Trametopsis cervina]|nr:hypothetical protein BDW22DRAFT_296956 [Trametopsis cervina]
MLLIYICRTHASNHNHKEADQAFNCRDSQLATLVRTLSAIPEGYAIRPDSRGTILVHLRVHKGCVVIAPPSPISITLSEEWMQRIGKLGLANAQSIRRI